MPSGVESTRSLDTSEVPACADSLARVHELDRLFEHLAGCIDGEPPPPPHRLFAGT